MKSKIIGVTSDKLIPIILDLVKNVVIINILSNSYINIKKLDFNIMLKRWVDGIFNYEEARLLFDEGVAVFGIDDNNNESEILYLEDLEKYDNFATELNFADKINIRDEEFDYIIEDGTEDFITKQIKEILKERNII